MPPRPSGRPRPESNPPGRGRDAGKELPERLPKRPPLPPPNVRPKRATAAPLPKDERQPLTDRILQLLGRSDYQPMDKVVMSKTLGLHSSDRREIRDALDKLEREGSIVLIRKDRYILPEVAQLVTGRIEFHRNSTAHIISEKAGEADVFIPAEATGIALHGDRVVVRLDTRATERREGAVIRILERATVRVVGTLKRSQNYLFIVPDDARFAHDVYVEPTPSARVGDKVVVRIDHWESRRHNPEGTIIETLGPATDAGVEMLAILRKHDLPERFPDAPLLEAERISETVEPAEINRREDCRDIEIVTIDPDDAKDFDDAIHVEPLDDGWLLQVHIADVSHYVTPGSALDKEASKRGNSTYLVDRVIPMLPERLSNGICSLKPQVERLTFAAFIEFDSQGRPRKTSFARAVIRSAHRYTYKQAFAVLQRPPESSLDHCLHNAWELASLLRKRRFDNGSLDLDFPEVKIWLDETGKVDRLERIENDISHQLIEEFMLAANEAVARVLTEKKIPAVYRVHEKPAPDRLREFRDQAATFGIRMGSPEVRGEIQKVLKIIRGKPEEYAVKLALLRRLMRARYDTKPLGHYGLAKVHYTHFTSPIRRYADLIVHRSLAFFLEQARPAAKRNAKTPHQRALGEAAEHISTTERTSADAESESKALKKMEYFERQITSRNPQAFRAIVTEVRSFGLVVDLPEAGQSGLIHVTALGDDFFQFDSTRQCFTSRREKQRFGLGDELTVRVVRVDRYKRQVDFAPVRPEEEKPVKGAKRRKGGK